MNIPLQIIRKIRPECTEFRPSGYLSEYHGRRTTPVGWINHDVISIVGPGLLQLAAKRLLSRFESCPPFPTM
jgi:hypothetical protein